MKTWLALELHALGGLTVKSEVGEDEAERMLGEQHRYIFPSDDLDDHEKVVQMVMTQIGFALEKQTGVFVTADMDGRTWMIPNAHLVAATITQADGQAKSIGFQQLGETRLKPA